jgi:alpha-D-xyloside xylohydrolase
VRSTDGSIEVLSKNIRVKIDVQNGQIIFQDAPGKLLLSEKKDGYSFKPSNDTYPAQYIVKQAFDLKTDKAIYGLGQHQTGKMNQRNQRIELKQVNMETAIPYFYSTNGYGLLWDNTSSTVFEDNEGVTSFESEVGNCIDYYFLRSNSAGHGLALFRELTGQATMFPLWTYGYWQSKERYKSQAELIDVVKTYRALKVPLDGIVQDWQYWGADTLWNSTEFGNPDFPRPKEMVDSVHKLNAHLIISVWPSFGRSSKIFKEFEKNKMLYDILTGPPNHARLYDAFNPKARKIYWDHMNRNLFSLGIDGWWLDATEPEQNTVRPTDDLNQTFAGSFKKVRNAYPIQSTGGVYNSQRKVTSDKRVFILTRSAFTGQQRFGTVVWSGDIDSKWHVLKEQIPCGLNMSVSGIPYWNSDIGGFHAHKDYPKGVADPNYKELYVRWIQFGAFTPMMRSHGSYTPREIYQFGKKGDWAYDAIEKVINLRYSLLPYIYSTAWNVTSKGSTFMRPLAMDFHGDANVYDNNATYMFGPSILVKPVTDSLYTSRSGSEDFSKVKQTQVYLPKGAVWYDFWQGDIITGGQQMDRDAPIDMVPLYVKGGAILPIGKAVQHTAEMDNNNLELRIYPGANGEFTLYEDENDNYNYEKGVYATITFKWDDVKQVLTINKRNGSYPGMLKSRTFKIVKVKKGVGHNNINSALTTKTVNYSGAAMSIKL